MWWKQWKKKLNQTSAPSAQIYSQKLCSYQINGLTNTFSDQHLFCVFSDQKSSKQILQEGTHLHYYFFFVLWSTTKVLLSLILPELNTQLTLEINYTQMCQKLFKVLSLLEASLKIQIAGGKITENLGFESPLRKVKIFGPFFFSFSNSSHKTGYLWF